MKVKEYRWEASADKERGESFIYIYIYIEKNPYRWGPTRDDRVRQDTKLEEIKCLRERVIEWVARRPCSWLRFTTFWSNNVAQRVVQGHTDLTTPTPPQNVPLTFAQVMRFTARVGERRSGDEAAKCSPRSCAENMGSGVMRPLRSLTPVGLSCTPPCVTLPFESLKKQLVKAKAVRQMNG